MAPSNMDTATVTFTSDACISADTFFKKSDAEELQESVDRIENKLNQIKNPVMYVFVNKGLKMNAGKVAAQVAHAQEELFTELRHLGGETWEHHLNCMCQNPRTVIILEAKDTDELYKINSYLESCDISTGIYVDEGSATGDYMLEPTAMACEYLDKCDPRTETIFRMFKLYTQEESEDLEPHLRKAATTLEKLSYIACHPSKRHWIKGVQSSQFRLDVLQKVAAWDEYSYDNNLLKYIGYNHETK